MTTYDELIKYLGGDFSVLFNNGIKSINNNYILKDDIKKYIIDKYFNVFNNKLPQNSLELKYLISSYKFIPGRIYTFSYLKKDTIDNKPIFLSLYGKSYTPNDYKEVGINLNLMPNKIRALLLKIIIKEYYTSIINTIKNQNNNIIIQNSLPLFNRTDRDDLFINKYNIPYNKAIIHCNYSLIDKKSIRIIDYQDWKYLLHYEHINYNNIIDQIHKTFLQ